MSVATCTIIINALARFHRIYAFACTLHQYNMYGPDSTTIILVL